MWARDEGPRPEAGSGRGHGAERPGDGDGGRRAGHGQREEGRRARPRGVGKKKLLPAGPAGQRHRATGEGSSAGSGGLRWPERMRKGGRRRAGLAELGQRGGGRPAGPGPVGSAGFLLPFLFSFLFSKTLVKNKHLKFK